MSETIRRMVLADIGAVHRLEQACFARPWSRDAILEEITQNPVARYLVCQKDGEVIGYAGAHMILEEGHITNIAVDERYRKRGIGLRLLEALMQYAANLGVRYLTLEVCVNNAAAIRLYQKKAFMKVHVRKHYYEETGEDAFLMVCDQLPAPQADFIEPETVFED